jgi:hypothetical protein
MESRRRSASLRRARELHIPSRPGLIRLPGHATSGHRDVGASGDASGHANWEQPNCARIALSPSAGSGDQATVLARALGGIAAIWRTTLPQSQTGDNHDRSPQACGRQHRVNGRRGDFLKRQDGITPRDTTASGEHSRGGREMPGIAGYVHGTCVVCAEEVPPGQVRLNTATDAKAALGLLRNGRGNADPIVSTACFVPQSQPFAAFRMAGWIWKRKQ